MANEIVTEIRLELDKFRSDLKQAEKDGKKAGENAGAGLGDGIETGLSGMLGGMKGKLLALAGTIASAFTLKESIAAAMEQERAINALNASLAMSGNFTAAASQHFQDFASQLQSTIGVADDVVLQGGAMLVTLGKLSGEGLDRSTKAALDFAAGMRIDVNSAFDLVAKAAAGNIGAFNKLGFEIKDTGNKGADFEKVLKAIEAQFGGRALTNVNTFEGAMARAKGQFGEVLESLGNVVIKSPAVIAVVNKISEVFERMAKGLEKSIGGRDVLGDFARSAVQVGSALNEYVIRPLELTYNILKTGTLAVGTGLMGIVTVFIKIREALFQYLEKPLLDFVGGTVGKLVGFFDKGLGDTITTFTQTLTSDTVATLDAVGNKTAEWTSSLAGQTADAANKSLDFSFSNATGAFIAEAGLFFDGIKPTIEAGARDLANVVKAPLPPTLFDQFIAGFTGASDKFKMGTEEMKKTVQELGKSVYTTFVQGFSNAFTAMGAALVKGENLLGAFGKTILGAFGDIAIQLGSFFIATGIPMMFTPGGQAAGIGLIAGGAALNMVGGVLKALAGAGGGAGATAPTAAGGGVAAGGGFGAAPMADQGQAFAESERGQVGTKVEINVAGNILDRRQTGLELAEIVNEAFGSNGVKFAGAV